MDTTQIRVIGTGSFFLFIFLSGFWLNHSGRPYSAVIFNIHKLIGLAAGIFLVMTVYRILQAAPFSPIEITSIAVTILFFTGNAVTGGLLSMDKPLPAAISMMHKLFPYLTVLSTTATPYLLLSRTS